jgi:ubiquinone biosynthesis protein UbiJ
MFAQPSAAALNHLLKQNSWASPRLMRFAGRTARFEVAPFSFAFTVLDDGTLRQADAEATADAVCVIPPSLLPRLALHDERAHAEVATEGDAALLTEIFYLARNLRWDAAEDLSMVTGDIAAERIVQFAQTTHRHLHEAVLNLSQAAAEYWTEERPVLAKPRELAAFVGQVDTLRDDAARLEQRVNQLARSAQANAATSSETNKN